MKKKIVAVALTLALVMGMSTIAFAADNTHDSVPSSEVIGVEGLYSGTGTVEDVYSVKIEWGEMLFTYTTSGDKTWDPTDHSYNVDDTDKWVASGNEVTVTNHSNRPVKVAFSFKKFTDRYLGKYTGSMDVTEHTLKAGAEGEFDAADKVTSKLTLDGQLNVVENTQTKLGEITVSLSSVTAEP